MFGIYAGDTDKTIYVRLRDSTTGLAKTGLVFNSTGAVASYTLPLAARAAITLATQTVTGAHSDGGFVEVDATNCKGLYRLDLPDAAIASGAFTIISIEFDGIIEESILVPLHTPKANVTQWLGTAAAAPTVAGVPEVDVTHWIGTAAATPTVAGVPEVDVTHWIGTAAATPTTAGVPEVDVTFWGGVAITTPPAVNATQISGDTTAADNLETAFDDTAGAVPWTGIVDQGTAQSATGTTVVLRAAAAFADNTLVGKNIEVFGSTQGYWQGREIKSNTLVDDTVTVDAWTVTPTGTITYKISFGPPALATPPEVNVTQISGDSVAADNAEAFFDGTGYAGTNNVIPTVTTLTGHTAQTGDSFARLGAPAGASVSADVAAVKVDTAAILVDTAEIGAAGAGLTVLATAAELAKVPKSDGTATWNATALASIQTEANDALVAQNLDHLVKIAVDTSFATTVHLDSVIGQIADAGTTATFDRTTDALEVLGAATAPSAATIADAVWDEALAGHLGVGSTGEALNAAGSAGDPWVTALPGAYGAGSAGFILGTNLNATVSSRSTVTTAQVNTEVDTALADIRLDELLAADSDIDGVAPPTVGSVFHELMSKTAGSFTFDQTTDSLEAIVDRGNVAWATATGFSTLDAAGVRTAVGLATANLDTQLGDIPTVAEFNARTLVAANYFDPAADTVANVTAVDSVTTKTGYSLAASGLDLVLVESGISAGAGPTNDTGTQLTSINARQAFSITISALGAVLAGAATTTITTKPAALPVGNTRITATVDSNGNRSAITLKVPD